MNFILAIILFISPVSEFLLSQQSHNMKLLAHIEEFGYTSSCWGYEAGGREYAIIGCYLGTSVVDITDENNIHEVGFINGFPNGWREMKTYGNYLYVVSEYNYSGIQIIDLSFLPDSVHLANTILFEGYSRAHTISQSGHYLYINGGNYGSGGIAVLDIGQDPENPVKLGEWENDYVHDSRIVNDTIWACNPLTGKVTIIDASNKNSLRTISSWVNGLYPVPHNCALTADNKYLFVCDENFNNPGKVKIWDISNKNDILFVSEWSVPFTSHSVHNVEIFGNYAFLSYYGEGVRVLDITDPLNPAEIAWYTTTACWAAYYFNSGKIIASDIYDGFYVFRTISPIGITNTGSITKRFSLEQNYPNPFNPITKIKFSIPKAPLSFGSQTLFLMEGLGVELIIYDALGREIVTLVNQQLQPGSYETQWNATLFPSGIYYYKLIVETSQLSNQSGRDVFTETRKMVLIR